MKYRPESAIAEVDVVNPEIQKDAPDDRGVVLDILVAHDDGTRSNIEMQAQELNWVDMEVGVALTRAVSDPGGQRP